MPVTSTKVTLGKRTVILADKDLLGEGGEARVYRDPGSDLAIKVFHELDTSLPPAERQLRERLLALKRQKLKVFPAQLPAWVVAPKEIAQSKHFHVVGYSMACVPDAVDIARLAQRSFRDGAISNTEVVRFMREIIEGLVALHSCGVVVGDLNDGNVVLSKKATSAGRAFLIDSDSMQFSGLPCPVGHERFLDPLLFGRDLLSAHGFTTATDFYALRIMLLQSLLYVHPYGGTHPQHKTLLRRAEARHSILRGDAVLPKNAVPFQTLPDDLLHDLEGAFDHDARTPLSTSLLPASWTKCGCGIEHARRTCPVCQTTTAPPVVRTQNGVREEIVLSTRGRILLARAHAGRLVTLIEENGRITREDGAVVFQGERAPGMSFHLAGTATWIAHERRAVCLRAGAATEQLALSSTEAFATVPDTSGPGEAFFLVDDVVWQHHSGIRAGRALAGRTLMFSGDERFALGVYRVGQLLLALVLQASKPLLDVQLPPVRGRVIDVHVTFGDGRALVGIASVDGGRVHHALHLIDERARLLGTAAGAPDEAPFLQSIRGKCLAFGKVLTTSDDGIAVVDVDVTSKVLRAGALFADTRLFVDRSQELLPGTGGSLFVVSPQAITQLTLK